MEDLDLAHRHSIFHKFEIMESDICGCFHCLSIFVPTQIKNWTDKFREEHTALCPNCGIDSVIGSKSNFPINPEFLKHMQKRWFGTV